MMKMTMGTILAIVTTVFMPVAWRIPRKIAKCVDHSKTDDTSTAGTVSPSPKKGNTAPSVALNTTK
ncbi:hypothetical protein D3C72_2072180 [compost metagenome]